MTYEMLLKEIIDFIKDFVSIMNYKLEIELGPDTLLLENIIGFDSLELAGLVAHLETLTNFDPFEEGFLEFFTISELAKLFSTK